MDYEDNNEENDYALQQSRSNDLKELRNADKQMPDTHKEKSLRACL